MRGGRAVEDNETVAHLRLEIIPTRPLHVIHAGCSHVDEIGTTGGSDVFGRLRGGAVVADGDIDVERPGEFRFSQRHCDSFGTREFRDCENERGRAGPGMVVVRGFDDVPRTPGHGDGPLVLRGGDAGGAAADAGKRHRGTFQFLLHFVLRATRDGAWRCGGVCAGEER